MTEQEIAEFLEANKQDIQQEVRRRLVEGLVSNHRWEISAQIAAAVDVFVKEQIVPEIKTYLEGEKGAILEAAKVAVTEIGNTLAKTMIEKAAKNMEGYSFRELVKGLFS
jgi:hypothetical protein